MKFIDGGYTHSMQKLNGDFLITKTPKEMTNKQAMILGTAGLTGLLCAFAVKKQERNY